MIKKIKIDRNTLKKIFTGSDQKEQWESNYLPEDKEDTSPNKVLLEILLCVHERLKENNKEAA